MRRSCFEAGLAGLALVAALPLTVSLAAETEKAGRRITVTGRAVGATPAAAEEARLDALREAVMRVCGSFINAQSETEDYALVRDKVLEQPVGFARVVRVLRGPDVVGGEITEIQLEAEVFPAAFERRWAEFAHIKQREGNPRCVVSIIEDDDPTDARPPVVGAAVQAEIENFLLSKDVQLMDREVSDDVRKRDLELAVKSGSLDRAAAAGAAFKADVVIFGSAEARLGTPVTLAGHTIQRWSLTMNLKAVQTDSAAVLVSKNYQPEKPYTTTIGTAKDALVALAREVAPQVLSDVGEAWRKRATVGKKIQLTFEPCSRGWFKAIQAEAIKMKGITGGKDGFILRELVNEVAQVDADWKYDLDQLADRIEEMRVPVDGQRLHLAVTEQTANRISVKVVAQPTAPALRPAQQIPPQQAPPPATQTGAAP